MTLITSISRFIHMVSRNPFHLILIIFLHEKYFQVNNDNNNNPKKKKILRQITILDKNNFTLIISRQVYLTHTRFV